MTKPNKPSSQKPTDTPKDQTGDSDYQGYRSVALVFTMVGVAMIFSEATRATGITFMIVGLTFFVLSR